LSPFDYGPEWLGLVLFSLLSGVAILWVFGRLTNQRQLQLARDRMAAAIYEIRLFPDSPARIVGAQLRLIYGSARYTLYTLPSLLVLSAPLALVFVHLEARHGFSPLDARAPVVLRVVLTPGVSAGAVKVAGDGFKVTAPPVFARPTRELFFRLAVPAETRALEITARDHAVTKEITTTPGARFVNAERASGLSSLLALGREAPLSAADGIERVSVHHESRNVRILFSAPWWVHWMLLSTISALAVRKRLGIVI
jgi:hypothetical protein